MNGRDLAISVLSITAVILLAAIVVVQAMLPAQALAAKHKVDPVAYTAVASALDEGTELLIVIDPDAEALNAYGFNVQRRQIELIQPPIPLDKGPSLGPRPGNTPRRPARDGDE